MIQRVTLLFRRYSITKNSLIKSITKVLANNHFNMNKVYFRKGDLDQLQISFLYDSRELGIYRQFNFSRKLTENVDSLTNRIITNLDKIIMKKKKKKSKTKTEDDVSCSSVSPSKVELYMDDQIVGGDVTCGTLLNFRGKLNLQMNEFKYAVVINSPWVDALVLPSCILAGFPVYPHKFESVYTDKRMCDFTWFSGNICNNVDNILWEEKARGYLFIPTALEIGQKLKLVCQPGNAHMKGPIVEAVTKSNVEAGPGFCPFETRHIFTQSILKNKSLRVVSYNILANLYCDSDFTREELFPYCPPYALNMEYRKQLLMKEILGYNSDITCLQEVDMKVFDYDLKPVLLEKGFNGIFTKKGGTVAEGIAVFYREDRFQLIDSHKITLSEEIKTLPLFSDFWEAIKENESFVNRFMERTVAAVQAVILKSIENPNELIVVGNTHLYFHPDADHIRLLQAGLAIRWLQNIVNTVSVMDKSKRVSLIFCGDFNSVPSNGVYHLYVKGYVPEDYNDWKSNPEEAVTGLSLSQDLPLESACGTPKYTNFTAGFSDCLDYIFYTKRSLSVEQVIPFPSEEELKQYTALPSVVFPSDHIALIADLRFT